MIKKEITDKVNQLSNNLCEKQRLNGLLQSINLLPEAINFFSYKLSDLLINYLNSSV